mgnify:CR=1 FL=1
MSNITIKIFLSKKDKSCHLVDFSSEISFQYILCGFNSEEDKKIVYDKIWSWANSFRLDYINKIRSPNMLFQDPSIWKTKRQWTTLFNKDPKNRDLKIVIIPKEETKTIDEILDSVAKRHNDSLPYCTENIKMTGPELKWLLESEGIDVNSIVQKKIKRKKSED